MKNSGIEWIGEIPNKWKVERIGTHFSTRNVKVSDSEYAPLSVTKQGILPQLDDVAKTKNNDDRRQVKAGDFVINSRSDRKQSCGVSPLDGSVSLINTVLIHRGNILPCYTKYLLKNYAFAEEFYRWGTGIVADLWSTKWESMKRIMIPVPDKIEQQKIAEILDEKCGKIDKLIENEQKQIEKMKEYKQSVITSAVTKGLDKSAPLKDSGIEWIGEIPAHWEMEKIKFNVTINNEKNSGEDLPYIALEHIESFSGKLLKTESVYDINEAIIAEEGEVLFGKLRPYLAKIYLVLDKTYVSSEFAVFHAINIDNHYLRWYLLNYGFLDTVNASTYGTKMPRANIDFIKNLQIPVFDILEQKQIAGYLDEKCGKIDRLIAIKQEKIEKLQEYKKSLIYEYVTGKKDVG